MARTFREWLALRETEDISVEEIIHNLEEKLRSWKAKLNEPAHHEFMAQVEDIVLQIVRVADSKTSQAEIRRLQRQVKDRLEELNENESYRYWLDSFGIETSISLAMTDLLGAVNMPIVHYDDISALKHELNPSGKTIPRAAFTRQGGFKLPKFSDN